ncbi:phage integrase [Bifidobacterium sp. GSD1FS]|uniref:Phage integrase n=2 Tax=Bifidobacterium canis TaxID=2610880 RepID=A0A7K1J467_9BIFI|nr:phage integrase [Bifidobacterium canis]
MPIGEHGVISFTVNDCGTVTAHTNMRVANSHRLLQLHATAQSKAKAELALKAKCARIRDMGAGTVDASMTLNRLADMYMEEKRNTLRTGSIDSYKSNIKKIKKGVGNVGVQEATPMVLQRFIDDVAEDSRSSAKTCKSILSGMFRIAVRNGALAHNPVSELDSLRRKEGEEDRKAQAIPLDKVGYVFERLQDIPAIVRNDEVELLKFMCLTGLRASEACGLQWDCVDFERGYIRVERQAERVKGEGLRIAPYTKTQCSRRRIQVPPALMDRLKSRHERQSEDPALNPHDLVFPLPTGNIREENLLNRHLREGRTKLGLPGLRITSHSFRKTCSTILESMGASRLAIRDQLGHEDVELTENVYIARYVHTQETASQLEEWAEDNGFYR